MGPDRPGPSHRLSLIVMRGRGIFKILHKAFTDNDVPVNNTSLKRRTCRFFNYTIADNYLAEIAKHDSDKYLTFLETSYIFLTAK